MAGALKEFGILAHSMGGLVARSAYYYGMAAGQAGRNICASSFFWARRTMVRCWSVGAIG